jgi:electron transfer flavoprotein alpha subunit
MNVLVLLHTDGSLAWPHLEALSAGLAAGDVTVGLIGTNVQAAADSIASCGAKGFVAVEGEEYAQARYSTDAAAAEAICRQVDTQLIVAAGTSRWMRSLPGVAARIGASVDSHVTSLAASGAACEAKRWFYRNRIEAAFRRKNGVWMLLLDGGVTPAWSGAPGVASVCRLDVPVGDDLRRTTVLREESTAAGESTIRPDSRLLLVAGAGWTKKQKDGQTHTAEAGELILDVLHGAQASLGSSKSLVDMGSEGDAVLPFLTHVHQVGQTGASPRHPKGLATCCHGEEPHVVGWRFINERRAINLDGNCGWARRKADVLYVADAFEVLREMRALLGA